MPQSRDLQRGRAIEIAGRQYFKNPAVDRYQIDLNELGSLRMCDIPPHSHLEVLGVTSWEMAREVEIYGLNGGDEGDHEFLSVYGGASFYVVPGRAARMIARLERSFPDPQPERRSFLRNPHIHIEPAAELMVVHLYLNVECKDTPAILVREAVGPFVDGFRRAERPEVYAFICHATEDKPAAREIAAGLRSAGAVVWLDEWEIRVGDSITQKVSDGLGTATHLILVMSEKSVTKPWVRKEFSAALMRQLADNSVRVVPIRMDDCTIPAILADVKYADARNGVAVAMSDVEFAIFG